MFNIIQLINRLLLALTVLQHLESHNKSLDDSSAEAALLVVLQVDHNALGVIVMSTAELDDFMVSMETF